MEHNPHPILDTHVLKRDWEQVTIDIEGYTFQLIQIKDPDALLEQLLSKGTDHPDVLDERIPYWAEIWPSSIGMATYLTQAYSSMEGLHILELGAGLGLPGLVAHKLGGRVTLTDYLPDAMVPANTMWQLNGASIPLYDRMDWRFPKPSLAADLVLASDVVYERRNYQPFLEAIPTLLLDGGKALLSEPRRGFSQDFFDQIGPNLTIEPVFEKPVNWKGQNYHIDVYEIQLSG